MHEQHPTYRTGRAPLIQRDPPGSYCPDPPHTENRQSILWVSPGKQLKPEGRHRKDGTGPPTKRNDVPWRIAIITATRLVVITATCLLCSCIVLKEKGEESDVFSLLRSRLP